MGNWEDEPRRDVQRANQSDVAKHRSKKNTRRWCRGKVGIEHETAIRYHKYISSLYADRDELPCYRPDWGRKSFKNKWWCSHEEYCVNCGKIMRYSIGDECPDFVPGGPTRFARRRP